MKNNIVSILSILFLSIATNAQEFNLPINNQFIADNQFLLSAAFAGIGDSWQARGTGFQQWVGIDNAPSTQSLSIDGRIADRTGVGLILFNDSNGFTSQKGVQASFAHHLVLTEYNRQYLSFGISYKFNQFEIDSSEFNRAIAAVDGDITSSNHNFDLSVLYRIKSFFLSLNAINILEKSIDEFDGVAEPPTISSYYAFTGFVFKNLIKGLEYEPSLLYTNFASDSRSTLDVNFRVRKFFKDDYFWGGLTFRGLIDQSFNPVTVSPSVGLAKSNFYFAYSYQLNLNESTQLTNNLGSHLITVGIDFLKRKSNCGCTY